MTRATVLIADDSLVIREVVRSELEGEGYVVAEAVDGPGAVAACRRDPPDAVLLDVEMPGLDGHEVLSALKGDAALKDIPVVFLTSKSGMDDVVAALRGGAHDYLRKPFETPELLARVASALHVKQLQDELRRRNAELDRLSRTDALTGLCNRRHLEQELVRLHADSVRHGDALCVLMLDLDHFKRVNDTFGHGVGDQVLQGFAERLGSELRAGDVGGRWGGEEFLVVLPRTGLEGALALAERIRVTASSEPVAASGPQVAVTVSVGCALGPGPSAEALAQLADQCLYEAKLAGRNTIRSASADLGQRA